MAQHRSDDTAKADRAGLVERNQRRRRQITFRRIADRTQNGERHAVFCRDRGDRAGFQIDGYRAGLFEQAALVDCGRGDRVAREHRLSVRTAKQTVQYVGTAVTLRCRQNCFRDDQVSGSQCRVKPAGEAKADQSGRTVSDGSARGDHRALDVSTADDHWPPQVAGDAGFGLQSDDDSWAVHQAREAGRHHAGII